MKSKFFYLTLEQIQQEINALNAHSHTKPKLYQAIYNCYSRGEYAKSHNNKELCVQLSKCSEEDFLKNRLQLSMEYEVNTVLYQMPFTFVPGSTFHQIPQHQRIVDVYVENVFYNALSLLHTHKDLFEVIFVYHGTCHFAFENEKKELHAGDFCIIAPGSQHNISTDSPEDCVIQQYIYSDYFRSSFVKILEDKSIISNFFKMILTNKTMSNYLLFSTPRTPSILQIARNLFLEQYKYDEYSPLCTFFLMQLLFSNILREGIHSYQFSTDFMDVDFAPILEYLQKNYKTASLSTVAAEFHYSVAYLSTYIKKITGSSYSDIIKELKMKEASEYLLYTDKNIEEIAMLIGYNSADHFSRVFRSYYGKAPSSYRSEGRGEPK